MTAHSVAHLGAFRRRYTGLSTQTKKRQNLKKKRYLKTSVILSYIQCNCICTFLSMFLSTIHKKGTRVHSRPYLYVLQLVKQLLLC